MRPEKVSALVTSTKTFSSCLRALRQLLLLPQDPTPALLPLALRLSPSRMPLPWSKPLWPHYATTLLSFYEVLFPPVCAYVYIFLWNVCLCPRTLSAR